MNDDIGDQLEYGAVKMGFQVTTGKAGSAEAMDMAAVVEKLVSDDSIGQIFNRYVGAPYPPLICQGFASQSVGETCTSACRPASPRWLSSW
jgi:hypothetical protein